MIYATQDEQRQLVHDCFNQNRERDCNRCPANYDRSNGICCFGDPGQHDPDDDDCQKCVFVHECAEEVADTKKREEEEIEREAIRQSRWQSSSPSTGYRTTIPVRRTLTTPVRTQIQQKSELVQIGGLRPSVISTPTKVEPLAPEETLFQRFVKDSVWGMGQGFFESAAHFFRTHRLR